MKTKRQLKKVMRRVAPQVERLSGLAIPRRWGFMKHPKIRWGWSMFWRDLHGMFFPDENLIVVSAINGFDPILLDSIVAHEYTHYLQYIHWTDEEWDNTVELERLAYKVSDFWVPPELRENFDELMEMDIYKNR